MKLSLPLIALATSVFTTSCGAWHVAGSPDFPTLYFQYKYIINNVGTVYAGKEGDARGKSLICFQSAKGGPTGPWQLNESGSLSNTASDGGCLDAAQNSQAIDLYSDVLAPPVPKGKYSVSVGDLSSHPLGPFSRCSNFIHC